MGQISRTDERYKLLLTIPQMTLKVSAAPFMSPRDMTYVCNVQFTNNDHSIELIINEYNHSKYRRVMVIYRNSRSGISLRYTPAKV